MLPFGLKFSIILSPFLLFYLKSNQDLKVLKYPGLFILIFSAIHLIIGVNLKSFTVSTVLMGLLVIYISAFLSFYKKSNNLEFIIEKLTQFNFVFTLLALLSMLTGKLISVFWYLIPFTPGYRVIPRLKLFESEASFYSFALLPLFFFYFWKVILVFNKKDLLLLLSILLSLILSFSLGVIAVIILAIILVLFVHFLKFIRFKNTRQSLVFLVVSSVAILTLVYFVFPNNPLFFRMENILNGLDTSGRGRTYESFDIAWQTLTQNNIFFGIGLGQFKIIGREVLIYYYKFMGIPEVARIPNAMAEILISYGVLGFSLKLIIQLVLFIKFKVYTDVFRLSLFFSLFIYQFTGSHLFNDIEFLLWVIVFLPKFDCYHQDTYFKK
jgi:hypothetical protein